MGTRRGCYRELRNSAIFNGLGWRGARMRIALFTISVYKPDKKKAKAKPEKAKVGKTNNA